MGIIYHDLKPENIMLAADGHVKVVDFGLAIAANDRQYDDTRMGTSMYMAPELAKHRVQVRLSFLLFLLRVLISIDSNARGCDIICAIWSELVAM